MTRYNHKKIWAKDYRKGLALRDISEKHGVPLEAIKSALKRGGIERRKFDASRRYTGKWKYRQIPTVERTRAQMEPEGDPQNRYQRIRSHARSLYKTEGIVCENCGWEHHVEICHKKSISDFEDDTLIGEINGRDNIMLLCPNCHWLLDNDLL